MESIFSDIHVCVMICLCMAPANFCKGNYLHVQCVCEVRGFIKYNAQERKLQ